MLVKEIQRDPLTQKLVHADFFQVDTKQKIHVSIPLHFLGKAHGVETGGVMETLVREVEAECLPLEIPDAFELDVSLLEIGDSLHISDIAVPEGVDLLVEVAMPVVHVVAPRVIEEPTEEGEGEGEGEEIPEGEAAPAEAAAAPTESKEGASE